MSPIRFPQPSRTARAAAPRPGRVALAAFLAALLVAAPGRGADPALPVPPDSGDIAGSVVVPAPGRQEVLPGSALVGQPFAGPGWFQGRPSAAGEGDQGRPPAVSPILPPPQPASVPKTATAMRAPMSSFFTRSSLLFPKYVSLEDVSPLFFNESTGRPWAGSGSDLSMVPVAQMHGIVGAPVDPSDLPSPTEERPCDERSGGEAHGQGSTAVDPGLAHVRLVDAVELTGIECRQEVTLWQSQRKQVQFRPNAASALPRMWSARR